MWAYGPLCPRALHIRAGPTGLGPYALIIKASFNYLPRYVGPRAYYVSPIGALRIYRARGPSPMFMNLFLKAFKNKSSEGLHLGALAAPRASDTLGLRA